MKNLILISLLFFLLLSCEKNTFEKKLADGTWVETSQQTDTLVFEKNSDQFYLYRGTELRGEYVLPKSASGPYSYELYSDSISLHWMLSSSMQQYNYYFKVSANDNELQIGNFFVDSLSQNTILTFRRKN